ncbi:MAG: PqqD family protein [Theionarchaea archaeon]|nr:PqqD family protein [Theionarchaea archaeon]
MKDSYKPKKAEKLITKEEDENLLIFDPDTGSIKLLNETGGLIWNSVDGNTTVKDIIQTVVEENPDETEEVIRQDVIKFLKEIQELNLFEE